MIKDFKEYLLRNRSENKLYLFYDIETLQYNERAGKEKPSQFKNVTYSLAFSYFDNSKLKYLILPNFYEFFELIRSTYKKWKTVPTINLVAHNGNKYDNHFMRHDLLFYYPELKVENIFLNNAEDAGNIETVKISQLTSEDKRGIILEKRVKSSNNLELTFFLDYIRFETIDNFVKTNMSLGALGKKLFNAGLLEEEYLETDFDYTQYNLDDDMTEKQSRYYAQKVFNQLDKDELIYIRNDVIILGKTFKHYGEIFSGFSYDKITFTSNILEFYNRNYLTSFQLLNKIDENGSQTHLKYTDFNFNGQNFYDYLKPFYRGGLNFYNQKQVERVINEPIIAIDINSSYPYVMHHEKIATYLEDYRAFSKSQQVEIEWTEDVYYLYQMEKHIFDEEILAPIESELLRQILVKYYSTTSDFIHINSYTIKMIENITKRKINHLTVRSWIRFGTSYFGGRDLIAEKYKVKEQGSQDKKIIYNSPYDIKLTNEEIEKLSQEEIDNSKVLLNGLYGIPALRPYFNLFRNIGGELVNFPNGFKNSERNIVFSIFVTSVALYNLLEPLSFLTESEIDENLLYCDTDSLYLKKKIEHKIPRDLFHDLHLGKWSFDETDISKMFIQNHKKYAYEVDGKIVVKSAGIPNDSFNYNQDFETFVETQFSAGKKIKNTKSIFNEQGTISIYESETTLELANGYPIFTFDRSLDRKKEQILKEVKEHLDGDNQGEDVLYIESPFGTFSMNELYPVKNDLEGTKPLSFLKIEHDLIKNFITDKS